ncbi:conserved Plasmodium protein, unknown function [Plasmodium vivax]|uniref:Uncharacterized protein n=1 Tax=Plasmodium vivax TaxID=5855 RepID=A0A1G4H166_PLAVI|nr:conserved Plasmodium protein, unknown function [Plasmodium vivax]
MRKKKKSSEGKVWTDALNNLEEVHQNKYSLTEDTLHERSRPEPEIIEHILEELENKIRFYFKLYQMEKEKRANCERKNHDLHAELNETYTTLQKNQLYTDKLESKLQNIKENQSSLIDTVRRIDLLYIQLDTLVQSFSGVCTQVAAELSTYGVSTNSQRNTLKTLLDYIYPCRTLDPRINSLYGVLYYGSIGLLKDGKFVCPPIPPIPPVVPSESDGWLPPSRYAPHNEVISTASPERSSRSHLGDPPGRSFSDSVRRSGSAFNGGSSKENYADDALFSKYVEAEQSKQVRSESDAQRTSYNQVIPQDLHGFCIKIGFLEISYKRENARIICVVRYDSETSTSAIQNTKRVTKPREMNGRANGGKCIFDIDYAINLTSLPGRNAGEDIPKFMIDVHDVNGKALIGTSMCSFVSEKTLVRDASWDIYSRVSNGKPEVIGKMHVSVLASPQSALLPAEMLSRAKQQSALPPAGDDRRMESTAKVAFQKSALLSKAIEERDPSTGKPHAQPHKQSLGKPHVQPQGQPQEQPHVKPLPHSSPGKGASLVQRGKKVTFKPYASKNGDSTDATKSSPALKEASKRISLNRSGGDSGGDSGDKSAGSGDSGNSGTLSLVQSRIKNLAKRFESRNGASGGSEEDGSSGAATPVGGKAGKLGGPLKKGLPLSSSKGVSAPEAKKGEQTEGKKGGPPVGQPGDQTEGQKVGHKAGQTEGQTEGPKAGQTANTKDALEKGPAGLKKSPPLVKDGVMKIKLPLPGKKDLAKKAGPEGLAKGEAAPPAKGDPADAAKNESDPKDNSSSGSSSNNVASKTVKPLLKIKVEPKKENLNKLFKKLSPKTPLASKEQDGKGSDAATALGKNGLKDTPGGTKKLPPPPLSKKTVVKKGSIDSDAAKKETPSEKQTGTTAPAATVSAPPADVKATPPSDAQAAPPKAEGEPTNVEKRLEKKISIKNKMLALLKIKPADPSAILKKPLPKAVSAAPAEVESQSSTEGPDLKNLLEKAKKNAIFIDKNKVNVKLSKKVEVKREIKKFVPKLKNFE